MVWHSWLPLLLIMDSLRWRPRWQLWLRLRLRWSLLRLLPCLARFAITFTFTLCFAFGLFALAFLLSVAASVLLSLTSEQVAFPFITALLNSFQALDEIAEIQVTWRVALLHPMPERWIM